MLLPRSPAGCRRRGRSRAPRPTRARGAPARGGHAACGLRARHAALRALGGGRAAGGFVGGVARGRLEHERVRAPEAALALAARRPGSALDHPRPHRRGRSHGGDGGRGGARRLPVHGPDVGGRGARKRASCAR